MPRILLVDDDDHVRRPVQMNLTRNGHEVVEARNGREAIDIYRRETFDVVITDLIMPEQEGLETIQQLRKHNPKVKIIAVSGGGRLSANNYLQLAERLGAQRTLSKPFTTEELVRAISEVLAA